MANCNVTFLWIVIVVLTRQQSTSGANIPDSNNITHPHPHVKPVLCPNGYDSVAIENIPNDTGHFLCDDSPGLTGKWSS